MDLNGTILLINKPPGLTSFDVVYRLRKAAGGLKTGHAGTLDPFAEGLLIVGLGRKATRRLDEFMQMEKEYRTEIVFGIKTDTGDCTGNIIAQESFRMPEIGAVQSVLQRFCGEIEQIPPLYSAVKVDGVRMYKAARRGVKLEAKPRKINIYALKLLELLPDGMLISVVCSRGTYIRTLAVDIAAELGLRAYLRRLIRTRIGEYTLEQALRLESAVENLSLGVKPV